MTSLLLSTKPGADESLLRYTVPDADDIAVVANMYRYVPGTDDITVVAMFLVLMTSLLVVAVCLVLMTSLLLLCTWC
jgi:hypothetical protein